MANKKIYTVEIEKPDAWYKERVGQKFEAHLAVRDGQRVAFMINSSPFYYINPLHCKVVEEKIIITN